MSEPYLNPRFISGEPRSRPANPDPDLTNPDPNLSDLDLVRRPPVGCRLTPRRAIDSLSVTGDPLFQSPSSDDVAPRLATYFRRSLRLLAED
ncbi:uncharacterized protein J3R85_009318 [Psidium guajava]|nr:uncharacterized protein J3R85_009318 [Psidium guajava]